MAGNSFALSSDGQVVLQQPTQVAAANSSVDIAGQGTSLPSVRLSTAPTPQVSGANLAGLAGAAQLVQKQNDASAETLEAIGKLTGGAIDKIIAQKQQEQYFDGMAQVTQGRALQDIEKDQPWYTRIFGPDATVKGAQAMSIMTNLQDAQTQFMNDMPQLRQQDPDAVRQYLVKQAAAINVGDPTVNAMIQSKLAEQWGTMLETHMKQHYAYVQETASNAYGNMQLSLSKSLQSVAQQSGADFLSTQSGQLVAKNAIAQMDANPGMDAETWKKSSLGAAVSAVQQGGFIYGRLFRQSQTYASMSAEDKQKFEQLSDAAENKGIQNSEFTQFGLQKAQIMANVGLGVISLNDGLRQAANLNAEFSRATGISKPFINGDQMQAMVTGNIKALTHAADRIQNKQDAADLQQQKLQAKATDLTNAVGLLNAGNAATAVTSGLVTSDEMDNVATSRWLQISSQDPDQAAQALVRWNTRGYIAPGIRDQVQMGIRQSEGVGYTDSFQRSADYFQSIISGGTGQTQSPGGMAAARGYFGDYFPQMYQFYQMRQSGAPAEVAYQAAFQTPQKLNNLSEKFGGWQKARTAIQQAVKDSYTTWVPSFLGGTSAADYVVRAISDKVEPNIDRLLGTGTNMDPLTAAALEAKHSGIDMIGEDGYIRQPGQATVAQTTHIPEDAMATVFSTIRDQKLQAAGYTTSDIQTLQRVDDPTTGRVNLYMILANPDKGYSVVPFSQDELEGSYHSDVVQKAVKKARAIRQADAINAALPPIAY